MSFFNFNVVNLYIKNLSFWVITFFTLFNITHDNIITSDKKIDFATNN